MIGATLKFRRSRAMHVVVATTLYTWLMDSPTIGTVFLNPANDEDANMILPAGVPGATTIVELKKRPLRAQNNSSPILRRFRMKDAQNVSTPLDLHIKHEHPKPHSMTKAPSSTRLSLTPFTSIPLFQGYGKLSSILSQNYQQASVHCIDSG